LERLSGERLHQWVGARYAVDGVSSDLHRLARQGVLLRALLQQGADFSLVLADPALVTIEGDPLSVLSQVRAVWQMRVFDRVRDETIGKRMVLQRCSWPEHLFLRARGHVVRLLRTFRGG
jgi:hypothetical protein